MAKIGSMELIVILIVAMLAIGPGALAQSGAHAGQGGRLVQKIHERRDERPARGQR